jgi:hypothetical protein
MRGQLAPQPAAAAAAAAVAVPAAAAVGWQTWCGPTCNHEPQHEGRAQWRQQQQQHEGAGWRRSHHQQRGGCCEALVCDLSRKLAPEATAPAAVTSGGHEGKAVGGWCSRAVQQPAACHSSRRPWRRLEVVLSNQRAGWVSRAGGAGDSAGGTMRCTTAAAAVALAAATAAARSCEL